MMHSTIYPNSYVSLRHLLLVEDDKQLSIIIRKLLEQRGLKCSVAENGLDAQRYLLRHYKDIHLVLTDYHMPRMDGVSLIQWMHQNRLVVPIILMSGDNPQDIREKLEPATIFAILKKPYAFSDLYLKIIEAFEASTLFFNDCHASGDREG